MSEPPPRPYPPARDAEVRQYPVGISVEQLASGWLRSENAPNGSTVVVDHEISGRQRLGIPWKVASKRTVACAVVVHTNLRAEGEALLWTVALVAAARTVGVRPGWPDLLFDSAGCVVGSVSLEVQFGTGAISSAIVSLRVDVASLVKSSVTSAEGRRAVAVRFSSAVRDAAESLHGDVETLRDKYNSTSILIGSRVRAFLLPHGIVRGVATGVSAAGLLAIESPTGMVELLNPINVLRVELLP